MSAIRIFLIGMLALIVSGCGHVVKDNLTIPPSATSASCDFNKRIIILPFADYSYADDIETTYNRNMAIMEALTDQLVAKGFRVPIQEDTLDYLIKNNIIKGIPYQSEATTKNLEKELNGSWSSSMKNEIKSLIVDEQQAAASGAGAPGIHGLNKKVITTMGKDFEADLVLRGRIIKYDLHGENNWKPWRRGILPFFHDGGNRIIFGIGQPDFYDLMDTVAMGETSPAIVGNAEVHIRLWIQDASTGDVIWTNRSEVKVEPKSIFAENRVDKMFHDAINQAAKSLIDDFWKKNELYL
ncbi:MAG: hypothetical protein KKE17_14410 [Proteobacteria bacterium]|nr:hypothetical protein [Pseudomonadota bacterium]MBU1711194.1 hypothetical protein [Pseudomonadota bacterium]